MVLTVAKRTFSLLVGEVEINQRRFHCIDFIPKSLNPCCLFNYVERPC